MHHILSKHYFAKIRNFRSKISILNLKIYLNLVRTHMFVWRTREQILC